MKTVINNSNVPGLWCSAGQQLISPGLFIVHFSRNSSHSCLIWIYSAVNVLSEGGFQPLLLYPAIIMYYCVIEQACFEGTVFALLGVWVCLCLHGC